MHNLFCLYHINRMHSEHLAVKPRIMDKNKLLPIRIKRGQPFNIEVSFVGEPAPKVTWKRKTLVSSAQHCEQVKVRPLFLMICYPSKIRVQKLSYW